MTTPTSRERRGAVAAALQDVDRRWLRDYRSTPSRYDAMADAALSAALPDRETLTLALAQMANAAYDDGMHGRAVPSYAANLGLVLSLVYGADDAQAGEVAW